MRILYSNAILSLFIYYFGLAFAADVLSTLCIIPYAYASVLRCVWFKMQSLYPERMRRCCGWKALVLQYSASRQKRILNSTRTTRLLEPLRVEWELELFASDAANI